MGAETGLSLLWIFPVTIVILAIVQEMVARLGVVTGQGLSDLIRERFGVRWTLFAMLVLLVANVANTVANFGGAAGALDIFGIPKWITVPVVAVAPGPSCSRATGVVERVFLLTMVVFLAYLNLRSDRDRELVFHAMVTPTSPRSTPARCCRWSPWSAPRSRRTCSSTCSRLSPRRASARRS
jgi:Mn2+/Fe2+ NRAMP family transporter